MSWPEPPAPWWAIGPLRTAWKRRIEKERPTFWIKGVMAEPCSRPDMHWLEPSRGYRCRWCRMSLNDRAVENLFTEEKKICPVCRIDQPVSPARIRVRQFFIPHRFNKVKCKGSGRKTGLPLPA